MKIDNSDIQRLGPNSYPAICKNIYNKLESSRGATLEGDEYLRKMYKTLWESTVPMMAIKPYITGPNYLDRKDPNVTEVIDYCKSEIKKGDLNFQINLAKEDHVFNLMQHHHPAADKTLDSIKEEFNKPSGEIVENIVNGVYDRLNSRLFESIKKNFDLVPENTHITPLLESLLNLDYREKGDNLIQYCPVGIMVEDKKNNRLIYLVEHDILTYDIENEEFINLNEQANELGLTNDHVTLINALNTCSYIPKTACFSLNENWDFNIELTPTGKIYINKDKEIESDKVLDFLTESVQFYQNNPGTVKNFNLVKYSQDADNFNILCQNNNKIVKMDKLFTIRNLNENNYIILDRSDVFEAHNPKILSSSKTGKTELFESFHKMVDFLNGQLVVPVTELFESQLFNEEEENKERNKKMQQLMEEQSLINKHIEEVGRLKILAEENSPAMKKLNEQDNLLNNKLVNNIKDLKELQNMSF
jgi:hypothetical protein